MIKPLGSSLKIGLTKFEMYLKHQLPLGLTAEVSAMDAAIHKKMFGFGMTTLIILNEEMNDMTKITKSVGKLVLLKDVGKTIRK